MKSNNNTTSIRLSEEIKPWIYRKMQSENRSLGNLINTILMREKEREEIACRISGQTLKGILRRADSNLNDVK